MVEELKRTDDKIPSRRYVKLEFIGYAPADLAIQIHLLGKECDVNICAETMKPYTEYNGKYDNLTQLG
jgi:hypothetical protein